MGVYKRGKHWYVDFYQDGRRIRRRTKAPNRRMAELVLHEEMKRAVNEDLGLKPVKVTNQEIIDRYVEHSKSFKAPKTVTRIELSLRRFFSRNEGLRKARPKDITIQKIQRYIKACRDEGDSTRTVNIDLRTLKAMFNKAVEWGPRPREPASAREADPGRRPEAAAVSHEGGDRHSPVDSDRPFPAAEWPMTGCVDVSKVVSIY